MGRILRSTILAALLLGAAPASACPLCESETGRRVRAGIFNAEFGYHLAVTLLPFPVFLAIIAAIHLGPPWGRGDSRRVLPPGAGDAPAPPAPTRVEGQSWTKI